MKVSEKQIEDWAERHVGELTGHASVLVRRQWSLPSGRRIDLLELHIEHGRPVLTVIELKAERARVEHLAQLLDYVEEVYAGSPAGIEVRGLLVAPDFEPLVRRLALPIHGVETSRLAVSFAVEDPPESFEPSSHRTYTDAELGTLRADLRAMVDGLVRPISMRWGGAEAQ